MPNQLKGDPTRTTMLRRKFVADMTRRFKKLSKAIKILIVDDDALGLEKLVVLQVRQVWRFRSNAQKVKAYRRWLQQQVNAGILSPLGGISGKPWTALYVESAYKKGALRAYTDLRAEELANYPSLFEGGQAEFLRTAFSSPVALHKIELLYERAFSELQGVTDAMGQQMSRTLSNGLAQGHGANKIARNLVKDVTKITRTRANVIARTEIVRAHAEGQLDAFELLGVEEVGIMAEWSTAGDERVCIECGELEGAVMTIKEARGLLPRHPNCRCAWIPANVKRHERGQLWGKEKDRAIARSIQAEAPLKLKRTAAEVKRRSVWPGKDLIKGKKKIVSKPKPKPKPKPKFKPKPKKVEWKAAEVGPERNAYLKSELEAVERELREELAKAPSYARQRIAESFDEKTQIIQKVIDAQKSPDKWDAFLYHGTDVSSAEKILKQGLYSKIETGEMGRVSWATKDLKEALQYAKEVGGKSRGVVVISNPTKSGFYRAPFGGGPKTFASYVDTPIEYIKEIRIFRSGKPVKIIKNPNWGGTF